MRDVKMVDCEMVDGRLFIDLLSIIYLSLNLPSHNLPSHTCISSSSHRCVVYNVIDDSEEGLDLAKVEKMKMRK